MNSPYTRMYTQREREREKREMKMGERNYLQSRLWHLTPASAVHTVPPVAGEDEQSMMELSLPKHVTSLYTVGPVPAPNSF